MLEELRQAPEGISARDLGEALYLNRIEQKSLKELLNRLQGIGLLRRHGDEFRLSESRRALVGAIRQRRRKMISFVPDDSSQRARGRIRVAPEDLNGAFDGDRVVASVSPHARDNERTARVEMILKRGRLRVVGRLHHGFRESWVESLDEKFPFDIELEGKRAAEADEGWIVVAEITGYPVAGHNPTGRIVEQLGASSDEPGLDIQIVIHKHDLPHIFPTKSSKKPKPRRLS